jgi:ferredoxin
VAPNGKEGHVPEKLRDAFDYLITILDGLCDFGDTIMSKRDKCVDCKRCWSDNASPMVHDVVWAAIRMEKRALLCEICLRKRLDGPLCVAHLRECPFNDKWFMSAAFYKTVIADDDGEPKPVVEAAKQVLDPTDVIPCYTVYLLDLNRC